MKSVSLFCLKIALLSLSIFSFTILTGQADPRVSSVYDQIPGQSVTAYRTGNIVTYRLTVADTIVNFTGNPTPALATNGSIPAPTLNFTEGDSARIYVTNRTKRTVSFHWHGLLLPNEYDGVPLLNTELIEPGATYLATFPIIQNGTYWYHSHTGFQEQKGLYGAIVIEPRESYAVPSQEVVLSDFTTQRPHEVLRQVKKHTDWYAIRRQAVQSYGKALVTGNLGKQAWLEWNRMPGMDLADIYYDAFLANGQESMDLPELKTGETIRLRIINGSASSHFWLHFAAGKMRVVAADGIEVEPIEVDKLLIATAETYDIEVSLPVEEGAYEFRATSWDRYRHTSVWLGSGKKHAVQDLGPIDYYQLTEEMRNMMKMMPGMVMGRAPASIPEPKVFTAGEAPSPEMIQMRAMQDMGMNMGAEGEQQSDSMNIKMDAKHHHKMPRKHEHEEGVEMEGKVIRASDVDGMTMDMQGQQMSMSKGTPPMGVQMTGYQELTERFPDDTIFDYTMLRSEKPTSLKADSPVRIVHLYLGGNMLRYVWLINNIPLSRADKIMIERGETVRFVFHNTTMMSHPMHLHGHFFRVINGQGENAPLKHTVNVAPMETTIIEFAATEDKDWFFHCHLLYHMMSGMARIIGYQGSEDLLIANQKDYDQFAMEDRKWWGTANLSTQSNGLWVDASFFNIYNELSIEGDANYDGDFETVARAIRYVGPRQFFAPYAGLRVEGKRSFNPDTDVTETEIETNAQFGLRYFLPMMIWSDVSVDQKGDFRFEVEREDIPLTSRWRASTRLEYILAEDTWEYTIGTSYILGQYWAVSANYDNRYGWGAGLKIMW
ncbi:multicopper oxidase domain-containing protein [Phaeodactylibacter xiamenensis]|jgi:CopA family copper-resistance protein|uniref:multicopper oxidase domain-containing protein n=1 Tax=Phaeodactylibacter xiamenensis TaxID=1524460 RepID=UPI0006944043|nr:multicopper oxidase domain-containing protein [Phaeodactylibacter xiamenensis]